MNLQNHATRWTVEEHDFAVENWDGHTATTDVIAELLGRTPKGVQQHVYEWLEGVAADPAQTKPVIDGRSLSRTDRSRRQATLVDMMVGEQVCSSCFEVKAANGSCGC